LTPRVGKTQAAAKAGRGGRGRTQAGRAPKARPKNGRFKPVEATTQRHVRFREPGVRTPRADRSGVGAQGALERYNSAVGRAGRPTRARGKQETGSAF
jgi:hypothetical protein